MSRLVQPDEWAITLDAGEVELHHPLPDNPARMLTVQFSRAQAARLGWALIRAALHP